MSWTFYSLSVNRLPSLWMSYELSWLWQQFHLQRKRYHPVYHCCVVSRHCGFSHFFSFFCFPVEADSNDLTLFLVEGFWFIWVTPLLQVFHLQILHIFCVEAVIWDSSSRNFGLSSTGRRNQGFCFTRRQPPASCSRDKPEINAASRILRIFLQDTNGCIHLQSVKLAIFVGRGRKPQLRLSRCENNSRLGIHEWPSVLIYRHLNKLINLPRLQSLAAPRTLLLRGSKIAVLFTVSNFIWTPRTSFT